MSAVFVVTRAPASWQTLAAALSNGPAQLGFAEHLLVGKLRGGRLKDRGRDGTDSCALTGAGEVEGGEEGGVGRGEKGRSNTGQTMAPRNGCEGAAGKESRL